MTDGDFEKDLRELDLRLFEQIPSQSTDDDKRSLLAVQFAVRELAGEYCYLEIGSYLGGSIQPHLLDPKCKRIYSIDKRPPSQPDERGFEWKYNNNSTKRMIEMLKGVSPDTAKIITIDGDTRQGLQKPDEKADLCFIDGEHTDEAVVSDFRFCLQAVDGSGVIVFHDSQITYLGIAECLRELDSRGVKHNAYVLPNIVFVVEIGEMAIHTHPLIVSMLIENHKSYLFALADNDNYRRFANSFPFGLLRRLKLKLRGGNVSE